MNPFILNQIVEFITFHIIALCLGYVVLKYNFKVNYTRKIYHFFVFFLPFALIEILPYPKSFLYTVISVIVSLCSLLIYLPFIKNRINIVQLMFKSFDRPEDQPHTLKWLFIQYLSTYLIAVPFYYIFQKINHSSFIYIPIFINAIGDGLAEPIGVKWGKHKYQVKALFSTQLYNRSIEGSLCVFITAIFTLLFFKSQFNTLQFITLMAIMPLSCTIAEAKSPHTIDSPFIFLVICGLLSIVYFFL